MKILIFTASAGNGHNSTAKRLKEFYLQKDSNSEIEIVDIYKKYATKFKAFVMEKGYAFACNYLMNVYNYFFKIQEKSKPENRDKVLPNKDSYKIVYEMLKDINDFKPDLIISTYIFASVALSNIKRVYKIPAKIACMTLDYGVSPFWQCTNKGIDYMFLSDEYMIQPFIDRGFKKEQLFVTGIPVANEFYEEKNKTESRKCLSLDKDLFTIIFMKSGFFSLSEKTIVKGLSKIKTKLQIVIINGKNERRKKLIDKYIKKYNIKHNVVNLGFTSQVPLYFSASDLVFGKAGGLTVTETIAAKLPSLITEKLAQQEIYNCDYLVKEGCALKVNKNNFVDKINFIINNKEFYDNMVKNCERIRKKNVLDKMYEILKNAPKPDYSIFCLEDSKKEVISKIDKKRKQDIKIQSINKKMLKKQTKKPN